MSAAPTLPYVSHDDVVRLVGAPAAERGRRYATHGHVTDVDFDVAANVLAARVAGTEPHPYSTRIVVEPFPASTDDDLLRCAALRSSCSCPVGGDCKHAAAALFAVNLLAMQPHLAILDTLGTAHEDAAPTGEITGTLAPASTPSIAGTTTPGQATPDWRTVLARMARRPAPVVGTEPLALGFELVSPPPTSWYERKVTGPLTAEQIEAGRPWLVEVRPLRPGRREDWIRGGLTWGSFVHAGATTGFAPAHVEVLSRIYRLHNAERHGYTTTGQTIRIDGFSSSLIWDLLAQAAEAGVAFVGLGTVGTVEIADPARFRLDVRDSPDGGLRLAPLVEIGERALADPVPVGPLGIAQATRPEEDSAGAGTRTGSGFDLLIAPLAEPLPPDAADLFGLGELMIGPEETEEFLVDVYPRLRGALSVVSADDSVALPAIRPPELLLRADFRKGDRLQLTWTWRYSTPRREISVVDDPRGDDSGVPRDRETEAATLSAVRDHWPSAALQTAEFLEGIDTARFAENTLPVLEALPGVVVEVSGKRGDYQELVETPHVRMTAVESERNDWFNLGVVVTVAGRQIPFSVLFKALARGMDHIILSDKSHFSLTHPAFDVLRRLLAESDLMREWEPNADGPAVSRYQVDLIDELVDSADEIVADADWIASVRALTSVESIPSTPVPDSVHAQLRVYQQEGFDWLAFLHAHRLGGILADDMGLGKTLQTLALIAHSRTTQEPAEAPAGPDTEAPAEAPADPGTRAPFLVVAPASVVAVWESEAARFVPDLSVRVLGTTTKKRGEPIEEAAAGHDIIITSYTLLRIDAEEYAAQEWAGFILDEAQFVKNRTSRVYRAAAGIRAPFRLAITGTPMENSLSDLWSLLSITAPGLFPSSQAFRQYYTSVIESGKGPERMVELRRKVRPFMLRRTKDLVASELPPKQEQVSMVELTPRHRTIYSRILQRERKKVLRLMDDVEGFDKNKMTVFRSLTLLRMAALDPGIVDEEYADIPSSKLQALLVGLEEIVGEGHRVIVFSQFTSFLQRIAAQLRERTVDFEYLDGSTTNRSQVIDRFKTGTAPVFLISLKAGGFGLTLTEADYVFLLDPWWNPAAEAQAVDRTHRIGQDKNVMVYRMVASDTIEEKVLELQRRKAELFEHLMDGGDAFSSSITAADLRGLFSA